MTKNKDSVTVTINFKAPISVVVEDLQDDKKILQLAKQAIAEQLKNKFPSISYSISRGNPYTMESAKLGQFASSEIGNKVEVGIIVQNTGKNIYVAFRNGRVMYGSPNVYEKVTEEINIEEFMWERNPESKNLNYWSQGDTGYFVNGKEIIPVIFGKCTASSYQLIVIGESGLSYKLKEINLDRVFDSKKEAEYYLNSRIK